MPISYLSRGELGTKLTISWKEQESNWLDCNQNIGTKLIVTLKCGEQKGIFFANNFSLLHFSITTSHPPPPPFPSPNQIQINFFHPNQTKPYSPLGIEMPYFEMRENMWCHRPTNKCVACYLLYVACYLFCFVFFFLFFFFIENICLCCGFVFLALFCFACLMQT